MFNDLTGGESQLTPNIFEITYISNYPTAFLTSGLLEVLVITFSTRQ